MCTLNPVCLLLGYSGDQCVYACVENVAVVAKEPAAGWGRTVICHMLHQVNLYKLASQKSDGKSLFLERR